MEYRGMIEQEHYHKGYLEGKASMIDLLKSAPIKGPTYKLSESNSIDVLTQINKSQAKEIEGLKEGLKLIKEYSMGFGVYSDVALVACDPRCNKIMDKCEELLKEVK